MFTAQYCQGSSVSLTKDRQKAALIEFQLKRNWATVHNEGQHCPITDAGEIIQNLTQEESDNLI